MRCRFTVVPGVLVLALTHLPPTARAVDTLEQLDANQGAVEAAAGWEGLGRQRRDRRLAAEVMASWGTNGSVSLFAGSTLTVQEDGTDPQAGLFIGGYRTLLDTAHLDVDALLDVSGSGPGLGNVKVLPLLEINLDLMPDGALLGLYTRWSLPVSTTPLAPGQDPFFTRPEGFVTNAAGSEQDASTVPALSAGASVTVGTYWTLAPGHQLLAELDLGTTLLSPEPAVLLDIGGLALGYNLLIDDSLESINQVYMDIPAPGERPALGIQVGFIMLVPVKPI